jgi:ribonuclease-3 family protein
MIFFENELSAAYVKGLSLRVLAHLGDAVFDLFERESKILQAPSARNLHDQVVKRVSAKSQAEILDSLTTFLSEEEADIVRRARNLKAGSRSGEQESYRKSTAFEALIGYLYLTDKLRLKEILQLTVRPAKDNS